MERTRIPKNLIIGLTLMALIVWNLMVSPGVYPSASRDFRMTGYLLPEEKADAAGVYILRHEGQRWVFKVTRAVSTSSQPYGASGYAILRSTGREQLRLTGRKEAIQQLNHPEMTCKGITLHGTLYASHSTLFLIEVEEASAKDNPESCR